MNNVVSIFFIFLVVGFDGAKIQTFLGISLIHISDNNTKITERFTYSTFAYAIVDDSKGFYGILRDFKGHMFFGTHSLNKAKVTSLLLPFYSPFTTFLLP
jgi:hypothetical protein